jgi:LemA protein
MGKFLVIVMVVMLSGCGYNSMQVKEEAVKASWGNVESLYQKRADLIVNIAEVAKGYAKHEKGTFVEVSQARASVGQVKVDPKDVGSKEQVEKFAAQQQTMGTALSRLMVVSEQYPQLKADTNFMYLQKQLTQTEDEINIARKKYNLTVQVFNGTIRSFPNSLTNSMMLHLSLKEPFKGEATSKVAPKLSF